MGQYFTIDPVVGLLDWPIAGQILPWPHLVAMPSEWPQVACAMVGCVACLCVDYWQLPFAL